MSSDITTAEEFFEILLKQDKYRKRLSRMFLASRDYITVDFMDVMEANIQLAQDLTLEPDKLLSKFGDAAKTQLKIEQPEASIDKIDIRLRELPSTIALRDLNSDYIGKLVQLSGTVVRVTQIQPLVTKACFRCRHCDALNFVPQHKASPFIREPIKCECGKTGLFDFDENKSEWVDYQSIRIQERQEELPAGQIPRVIDIKMTESLVDVARAGDLISVIGTFHTTKTSKSRIFQTYIKANNIEVLSKEAEAMEITEEDKEKIKEIAKHPLVHEWITNSIVPSIYGYREIKEAISYLIFGGMQKEYKDITIRGELNVLLVGDPGTAKSQLLQGVSKLVPRGIYASGRGATAAGLTASVVREAQGWALEVGALVLADKGIACVDEMDKMRPEDRVAIHEAMEQHTVCYDDRTELLTKDGWKLFRNLTGRELIMTLNPKTNEIEYQPIVECYDYPYEGQLFRVIDSRKVDLMVTPNHTMYVAQYKRGNHWHPFNLICAEDILEKRVKYKRDGKWNGEERIWFILPSIKQKVNQYRWRIIPEKYILMDDWLEFFGYWLAEGYANTHQVRIAQTNVKKILKIKNCLDKFPFKYSYKGNNFIICNSQLAMYLLHFGKSPQKYIPKEIKTLSSRQLKILLEAMMLGDGSSREQVTTNSINRSKQRVYYTTSRHLADDVQEILLKIGLSGNIHNFHNKNRRGQLGRANYNELGVSFIYKNQPQVCYSKVGRNVARNIWSLYEGRVYCVEVERNHIIYVRRNGIPVWSGNSINKAGINTTLNARMALLGAANPTLGRYDQYRTVAENIEKLPITILSRFDLIFIMRDIPDKEADIHMTRHILGLHREHDENLPPIEAKLFKKYVGFARKIKPKLTKEALECLQNYYLKLRKLGEQEGTPIAITPRQLESLQRITEAHARIALKEQADTSDAEAAIKIMSTSFEQVGVDTEGGADIDMIMTRIPANNREKCGLILGLVIQAKDEGVNRNELYEKLQERQIGKQEAHKLIDMLKKDGVLYEPVQGNIRSINY